MNMIISHEGTSYLDIADSRVAKLTKEDMFVLEHIQAELSE